MSKNKIVKVSKIFLVAMVLYIISKAINSFPILHFDYLKINLQYTERPVLNLYPYLYYHEGIGSSTIHIQININYYP